VVDVEVAPAEDGPMADLTGPDRIGPHRHPRSPWTTPFREKRPPLSRLQRLSMTAPPPTFPT
jgi:hypothetical protein